MTHSMSTRSWAAAAFILIAGCGGQSESDGSGGTSGTGAAAGSGGSTTGGTSGTSGTSGGGGSATGGGGGGTGGSGVGGGSTGGSPGSGGAPCAALEKAYDETLVKAKSCNPAIDFNECTATVGDQIACPCFGTYVNAGSPELATLQQIQNAWDQQKCGAGIDCPLVDCAQPLAGGCVADSVGSGMCEDLYGK
jgi:hypothetical protein